MSDPIPPTFHPSQVPPPQESLPATPQTLRPGEGDGTFAFEVPEKRYSVKKEHARGGMGRILVAADELMGRDVAIKEILAPGAVVPAQDAERFLREARITAQLEHPNIVPVHEIGRNPDGSIFYTMKFVRGETMAQRLDAIADDGSLSNAQALAKRLALLGPFADVCNAVAYAHSRGVVNRDLKPANIMLGEYGETLVLDWGLARAKGVPDANASRLKQATRSFNKGPVTDSSKLTYQGDVLGTPAYMPPEQAAGRIDEVDEKSDVYSLGAILYEILTGCLAYMRPDPGSADAGPPIPILAREREAPPELVALVERAMETDRSKRLDSAKFLADEVNAFRDGRALASYDYSLEEQVRRFVKRNRALSAALAALFLVSLAAAVVSSVYAQRASREAKTALDSQKNTAAALEVARDNAKREAAARAIADGERITAIATQLAPTNPGLALLLGLEAAARSPGPAANDALLTALDNLAERKRFSAGAPLRAAALSPDGSTVAAATDAGGIVFFDAVSGREKSREPGVENPKGVAFSEDGKSVVTWGTGFAVKTRDWTSHAKKTPIRDASFDPDGARVLAVPESGAPFVVTLATGAVVEMKGLDKGATVARWSPDGRRIAAGSRAGFALIVNPDTGTEHGRFDMGTYAALDVAWDPDGRVLHVGSANGAVHTFEIVGNSRVGARDLAVFCDDMRIYAHPEDGRLGVACLHGGEWDVRLFARDGNGAGRVTPFASRPVPWSGWEGFAAIDGPDLLIRFPGGKRPPLRFRGHEDEIRDLEVARSGVLVTASTDGTAATWDSGSGVPRLIPPEAGWSAFVGDGALVLATGSIDDPLELYDSRTGEVATGTIYTETENSLHMSTGPLWRPTERIPVNRSVDPTGRKLLAFFDVGPALILEASTGKTFASWNFEERAPRRAAWSASGQRIVFFWSGGAEVRRGDTGALEASCALRAAKPAEVAVADDGQLLAVIGEGSPDVALMKPDGSLVTVIHAHEPFVRHAVFHPSLPLLLTTGADASVRLWSLDSRAQVASVPWPRQDDITPSFSMNGHFALLASPRAGVRLVDGATLATVLTLQPDQATQAAFLSDRRRFVAWTRDRAALWPLDPRQAALDARPRELTNAERERFGLGR